MNNTERMWLWKVCIMSSCLWINSAACSLYLGRTWILLPNPGALLCAVIFWTDHSWCKMFIYCIFWDVLCCDAKLKLLFPSLTIVKVSEIGVMWLEATAAPAKSFPSFSFSCVYLELRRKKKHHFLGARRITPPKGPSRCCMFRGREWKKKEKKAFINQ